MPVKIDINARIDNDDRRIQVRNNNLTSFVNDGDIIVSDRTGCQYRVMSREKRYDNSTDTDILVLDTPFETNTSAIWVVPPPVTGGKSPLIGVYQRVLEF
jgi:hypothetical protein